MLVPDRSADTDWKRTCPWCGRKFPAPTLMQDHEQQCPRWGLKPGEEDDDGAVR